jgi:hypothetical protein
MTKRHVFFAATCAMAMMMLSSCSAIMEARPVCTKPHGGANMQLAPMYQCIEKVDGRKLVNAPRHD